MRVEAVTLIVLRCADIERSRAFYAALGIALVAEQHGAGAPHWSASIGDVVLELYPQGEHATRGLRLGLRVTDVASAVAALQGAGGALRATRVEGGRRRAVVEDPDGHVLELSE